MELKYYINDKEVTRWRWRRDLKRAGFPRKMIKRIEGYLIISASYYTTGGRTYTIGV